MPDRRLTYPPFGTTPERAAIHLLSAHGLKTIAERLDTQRAQHDALHERGDAPHDHATPDRAGEAS